MAISGVNNDIAALFTSTALNRKNSSNSDLTVNDFLTLIAAQMRNQDMMNPMNDTEFMGQLAQFTTLQSIQNLTMLSSTSYSVSLLGKEITAARMNMAGRLEVETGVVTGVGLFNGEPLIYIGEKEYSLQEIMVVGKLPEPAAPVVPDTKQTDEDEEVDPDLDPGLDPDADKKVDPDLDPDTDKKVDPGADPDLGPEDGLETDPSSDDGTI